MKEFLKMEREGEEMRKHNKKSRNLLLFTDPDSLESKRQEMKKLNTLDGILSWEIKGEMGQYNLPSIPFLPKVEGEDQETCPLRYLISSPGTRGPVKHNFSKEP